MNNILACRRIWSLAALLSTTLLTACLGGRVDTGEVPTVLLVSTFAGQAGTAGSVDGKGTTARFDYPVATAVDKLGNIYVADYLEHVIRKITPEGMVSTFAGQAGSLGTADGAGAAARFNLPVALTVDNDGNVYVGESGNHTIRKINASGVVTTVAGSARRWGWADGTGSDASFHQPAGLALDTKGNLYVSDYGNHAIRKITFASGTSDATVTTLAGSPRSIGSADGQGTAARFNFPVGLATDKNDNVYVADKANHVIRKIDPSGVVSTLAGSAGASGHVDGIGTSALLDNPVGIAVDSDGDLFVSEATAVVRKITPNGTVNTIAGEHKERGTADGAALRARFVNPGQLSIGPDGLMYLPDTMTNTIRKFEQGYLVEGTVTGLQSSVILANSNGDTVAVNSSDSGSFEFPMPLAKDKPYEVTVQAQPAGQTCTVANGSGTVGTERTEVEVTCKSNGGSTVAYPNGGTLYNLAANSQIVLENFNREKITLESNGPFKFKAGGASSPPGSIEVIRVLSQPVGQTCIASQVTAYENGAFSDTVVNCSNNTYTVGASVSGLTDGAVMALRNNGGDEISFVTNGTHDFPMGVTYGGAFNVTVSSQPVGQTCTVSLPLGAEGGSGTVAGDTRVIVQCVDNPVVTYTIGGTVSGMTGGTLVLQNNAGDNLNVTADGRFQFATPVMANGSFSVSVLSSPAGKVCEVLPSTASGTATTNVTEIQVTCMDQPPPPPSGYPISGVVNGLNAVGLVLQNGADYLPVFPSFGSTAPFTFATPVPAGTPYNVVVESQPMGQTCTVTSGGSGMVSNPVTDVVVDCN